MREEIKRTQDEGRSTPHESEGRRAEPIAIIGMGCTLPGGSKTPERFWELLRNGVDAVTEIPRDRFNIDDYYHPEPGRPGKTHTRYGAFVEGITEFDPVFAGVAPKHAASVDPQQRLFAGACWAALEDAGIPPLGLDGSLTGVFVGLWSVEYWHRLASRPVEELDGNVVGGNLHCMASGAISYLLGLRGPSLTLDTACSSSMVAVDLAVQSLRAGASDLALAGGANAILGPENYVCFSGMQVLSTDGRCKAFDASADGFGRGEGAGAVVLKRLSDALRDGDRIQAVIYGSAVTQDGKTAGIAVPNGEAQEDAARRALRQADISPADVAFAEAHGTGTSVGDPIEVRALGNVYGKGRAKDQPLLIGTVKTNIGHLESAAGIASLIKVVLSLQHEAVPPNLHFKQPNPAIPWDELAIKVPTELVPWPRGGRPRYAAVSSFGVSGTNAHLVVGEGPALAPPKREQPERPRHVLVLSAKDKDALRRTAEGYATHFAEHADLDVADACFTAATGRSFFRERLAVVGASGRELGQRLRSFAEGRPASGLVTGKAPVGERPRLGFLFTGQGAQYVQMGRGLYESQPVFRRAMDRCDEILRPIMGSRILDVIYPPAGSASPIDDTTFAQPALFALEYAVCEMWKSWGIEPDFVIGHSAGEDVAACVAGVFSLEDGLRLIAERGRLMGALPREGSMVAIMASEARVAPAVAPHRRDVSIATLNGPDNVVISGRTEIVERIARAFEAEGVETRPLKVSHAFHSPLMDPMLEAFDKVARAITYSEARIPLVSNLTGAVAGDELRGPEHWVTHIQKPVRFADGIAALHRLGCQIFVEVGPKPTLSRISQACLPPGSEAFLPTLHPGQDDMERTLQTLGELFVRGVGVDWKAFDAGYGRRRISLPTYPVKGQRYWIEASPTAPGPVASAPSSWVEGLVQSRKAGRLEAEIRGKTEALSPEDARLLAKLVDVFADEYERRTAPRSLVASYYNAIPAAAQKLEAGSLEEEAERYLTFGPFATIEPHFSWVTTFADPLNHQAEAQRAFEAQKEMREALFRRIDFGACQRVLDFGCGYASDLVTLARKHPHLRLTGYTIASEQAKIGARKAAALGVGDRVQILNRDSARDEFPGRYDLAFGFEVAHHVPDKTALFANLGRHLEAGGHLVLADFISRAGFSIDHAETSSFFITKDEWNDHLSSNHFEIVECVDISQEIANFLHDPDFDRTMAKVDAFMVDANIRAGFKSYDQLGRLLRQKLTDYVLLTARKRPDLEVPALRKWNERFLSTPVPYSETSVAGGCYDVEWVPKDKPAPQATAGSSGRVLVFADNSGQGAALARRLERDGNRCVLVARGPEYARTSSGFVVDPARPEDMQRVLAEAGSEPLRGIVHLWSLDAPTADALTSSDLAPAQELGCLSVLHLVQAVAGSRRSELPRILLVTRRAQATGDGPVELAQAPLIGLGKTLLLEHPELFGGMVDLDSEDAPGGADRLAAELVSAEAEYHVAYRGGKRLVARLARRRRPAESKPPIDANASYLVAGGLGALGLRLASWLVEEGARHLLLTGRRAPGEAALEVLRSLERAGARVRVVQADVATAPGMAAVMESARALPPLKGVINAAGVLDDGVLLQQNRARFEKVLGPKVQGSFRLHEATRDLELDFFVCFSSAAALFGSAGQANYAAANAFMDALAAHRRASGLRGLSVAWGAWAGSGMAANLTAAQRQKLAEGGVGEIDPRQGLRLLGDLIAEGRAYAGVSPMNWAKYFAGASPEQVLSYFERLVPPSAAAAPVATPVVHVLDEVRQAPASERGQILGRYVQDRVASILGYEDASQVDRDLTLLELGFDSLMAVQLRNQIRTSLGTDLPMGKLFDSTSIEELAVLLEQKLVAATAPVPPGEHVEVI